MVNATADKEGAENDTKLRYLLTDDIKKWIDSQFDDEIVSKAMNQAAIEKLKKKETFHEE